MSFFKLKNGNEDVKNTTRFHENQLSKTNILSRFICHRIPERTFNFRGHYFPVCSRCTGFYIGAVSYFIVVYYFYVQYTITLIILALLMLIPPFLDGFTQLIGTRESTNILRFCTGLLGGIGLAIIIKAIKWVLIMG